MATFSTTATRPRTSISRAVSPIRALPPSISYYGAARAHLNLARRVADSRTPGLDQLGTVWLPLPPLLMAPLARDNRLWRTGLAGAIPSAVCFVLAGSFLFAAVKSVFSSRAAGAAAPALVALNPHLLYLPSPPITHPLSFACMIALLH